MMDNRQFNVNGEGKEMLLRVFELACIQEGHTDQPAKIVAYRVSSTHGMILYWHEGGDRHVLPVPLTAEQFLPIVWAWLGDPEANRKVVLKDWDRDLDHDGSNGPGWRVYCEDWGHVDGDSDAICAVKPVFLWFGK